MDTNMKEVQEVDVAVNVSGYHASWDELTVNILWDYTNDRKVGFSGSKEEADKALDDGFDDYSDCIMMKAVVIDGQYYLKTRDGFL